MSKRTKCLISFLFFIPISFIGFSQQETWKWYFSGSPSPGLDFSSGSPVLLTNSGIGTSFEGNATISDVNGNLLFYTDGHRNLFNKNHAVTPNGGLLFMHNSVTQGSIFVPKPGNPNIYYLIYLGMPTIGPPPPWNLYYSEIDITLNGGFGDINASKNISIASSFGNCAEKLAVTKHCNGTDYWLLVHDFTGASFRAYLISAAGINAAPVISSVGSVYVAGLPPADDAIGQLKFSPNGVKVGALLAYQQIVELYDFNALTGVVSNPINLGTCGTNAYGLEFSPDNSKIYACNADFNGNLSQWDLCAGNPAAIIASKQTFPILPANATRTQSLQLASDGKIYGANFFAGTLAVINNPNVAGAGCNFSSTGFSVAPQLCYLGLPAFISSYFDTPANTPQATATQVNSGSCGCTGSATASICTVFGSSPYTYSWSNGTTIAPTTALTSTISNLCPGTYSVIVSDATCKSDTLNFTITGAGAGSFTVTPTTTAATCGVTNGTASVSVSGGTQPLTYVWTPGGQSGPTATGLAAGTYTVTITDAANCTQTSVINIPSTGGGTVTITPQNISCNGAGNGMASASISGGTAPFTYLWSNGNTTSQISNLSSQIYSVTVTDASACTSTQTVSITEPTAITASVTSTQTNCGLSTGTAFVTVTGGSGSYTYFWNPSSGTTSVATGLSAGIYSVTITDGNGCTHVSTANITNANGPIVNISSQTPTSCFGGNNGTATASGSGGTAPYTYFWSNGNTTAQASNLSPQIYSVIITDASGCTNTQTVSIAQPTAITATTTNTPAGCGLSDGSATATASGGTPAYTYNWSTNPAQNTPTAIALAAGSYTCTITDLFGCTSTTIVNIANGNGPTANAGVDVTIQQGASTQLAASGGITYNWSPSTGLSNTNTSNPTASPTTTIIYCVVVTDAGGCIDSDCVVIHIEIPCGEFYLPNAFSPNDDNENDEFKAYINPLCVSEFKLIIFNRWGEKVFETEDVSEGWDGMFRGNMSNPAVYAYYCKAVLTNGKEILKEGNISLVR